MQTVPPIWITQSPSKWSKSPEWMTFHFLVDAERCPRSAALRSSAYPAVWDKVGYPEKPSLPATTGRIIHMCVQRIACELALNGCGSVRDARAIQILRSMGGYSTVIAAIADLALGALDENPRFYRMRDSLSSAIRSQIHRIREKVQILLSRLDWRTITSAVHSEEAPSSDAPPRANLRNCLRDGTHFEVELRDELLRWKGVADVIDLSSSGCSITDFKSGNQSESHELQIRIYAVLWRYDIDLNPHGQLATRLVLSYPGQEHVLEPLSTEELAKLRAEIKTRTDLVRQAVDAEMPKPNLSDESCNGCQVRHLCVEYWTEKRRRICTKDNQGNYFDDLEVIVTSKRSELLWEATCLIDSSGPSAATMLMRLPPGEKILETHLAPGKRLRITGALVLRRDDDELPLVQITATSEFLFPGM
jgi:CRISPR/Cas system-associated exonuclease Cas4 (RecB family)